MIKNFIKYLALMFGILMTQTIQARVVGGVNFPNTLASFELRSVFDNEPLNPGLGVTLLYNSPGVKISVFVYDKSYKNIADGIESMLIYDEFNEAKFNINKIYSDVKILKEESRLSIAGTLLLQAIFRYNELISNYHETVFSHLYLTAKNGKFIKIRSTYSSADKPELSYRLQRQFIEALCQQLGRSVQN